jgi:phenylalanyl-tRNA synthetase alpha chain
MGVERLTMLKHGISDLRGFFESDLRWIRHYGLDPFFTFHNIRKK